MKKGKRFHWHQIQVLALFIGTFLVSLSFLKVAVLGCVVMEITLLCRQLKRKLAKGF
jgi:hypothetical protein